MEAVILGLALAATSSVSLPVLGAPVGDMPNWFNESDWTDSDASGSVRFKVVFNRDGFPETCVIQATTGNKEVETLACAVIKKRFRFKPSLGTDGIPVERVMVRAVAMGEQVPDNITTPPLISVIVNGYKNVSRLWVAVEVNKNGSLASCFTNEKKESLINLGKAACQTLTGLWQPLVEVDATGAAFRYIRDVPIEIKSVP